MPSKSNTLSAAPPGGDPIKLYTGAFGQKQLHHLLRRTLFGVSIPDLKAFQGKTMEQVVDALLNVSKIPPPPVKNYSLNGLDVYDLPNDPANNTASYNLDKYTGLKMGDTWVNYRFNYHADKNDPDGQRRSSLKAWWSKQILEQDRTILEKMTMFLHNHFATQMTDVTEAIMSYNHNTLLRKYALGNFKELTYKITLDPQMLVYLNGDTNNGATAESVNENYGRELQELFTVGKGLGSTSTYTEDDVKAAARVLSGWRTTRLFDSNSKVILDPAVPMTSYFNPARHDIKDKTFSAFYGNKVIKGKSGATAGEEEITELIDMIFSVEETSKFIVRKLFRFFVDSTIDADVETNVIEPLAELFRTSKFELKPVLKALFQSEYFYKDGYIGAMIKSPIDFVFGHHRMFQLSLPKDPKAFEANYSIASAVAAHARLSGQDLGDPPNVAGWAAYYQAPLFYEIWLDASSLQYKHGIRWIRDYNTKSSSPFINKESKNLIVLMDYFKVIIDTSNPNNINTVISDLALLMYPAAISQVVKDKIKKGFFAWAFGDGMQTETNWTMGVNALIANPSTTDKDSVALKNALYKLIIIMFEAAEYQLH